MLVLELFIDQGIIGFWNYGGDGQQYLVRLEMGGGSGPPWLFLVFTYGISGGPPEAAAAATSAGAGGWSEFRGARSMAELRRRIIKLLLISWRLVPGEVLLAELPAAADIIVISHVFGWWWRWWPRADGRRSSTSPLLSFESIVVVVVMNSGG